MTSDDDTPAPPARIAITPRPRLGIKLATNRARTLGLGSGATNRAAQLGIRSGASDRAARLGIGSSLERQAERLGVAPDDGEQEQSA